MAVIDQLSSFTSIFPNAIYYRVLVRQLDLDILIISRLARCQSLRSFT